MSPGVTMLERISRREEADLFIAWIAIAVSFTIINITPYGLMGSFNPISPLTALIYFGISLLTVGIGFIFHEMAHKFVAIRFGYWAEFVKDNTMLLVAVIMAALAGFVFAAPGATVIYSRDGRPLTKRVDGIISAAGPVMNLILCVVFAALFFLAGGKASLAGGNLLAMLGIAGVQINAMIAAFNLLPISILDGRKVFAWNIPIFFVLIIAAFGTLVAAYYHLWMLI
ncbi:zinc metalloprotease [Methanoregula formicica]|uniref:Zn-dependent protease n=1 Tax=Methanoregula formicica (strain DSM 22288 / NBRC 105244 / SMSP) TaxID=593750 RepID=L0HB00_METFS|nr:Zn-dependent protease [Methanoregula formicica]AGB01160.1 Zn-dependent protease [Methanoregula formicica SMSP]